MRRIKFGEWSLVTEDRETYEIDLAGIIVGRVHYDRANGDEDDILVTDYSTDIDEDGSYGGAYFTSPGDAWDYIRRVWKDDIAEVRRHEMGEHRSTRRPDACPACKSTLKLARNWQQSDSTFRDREMSDEDIVAKYLFHAEMMSRS